MCNNEMGSEIILDLKNIQVRCLRCGECCEKFNIGTSYRNVTGIGKETSQTPYELYCKCGTKITINIDLKYEFPDNRVTTIDGKGFL